MVEAQPDDFRGGVPPEMEGRFLVAAPLDDVADPDDGGLSLIPKLAPEIAEFLSMQTKEGTCLWSIREPTYKNPYQRCASLMAVFAFSRKEDSAMFLMRFG